MTKRLDLPETTFREVIHRLRYWFAMKGLRDIDKIRVEIHFPDEVSQHHAGVELLREWKPMLTPPNRVIGPIEPQRVEIEGVSVTFTNPTRYDVRR